MKAVQIGSLWYVVIEDCSVKSMLRVVDGPYQEEWQAISAARIKDTWDIA